MASVSYKSGVCPKCESGNTEVVLLTNHKDDGHGGNLAYGICRTCGFQDQTLRGDDPDLLVAVARKSFSTVYFKDGAKSDGLPTVEELAHDLALLIKTVCKSNDRCETCPMHGSYQDPIKETDEGYFVQNGRLGLKCAEQDEHSCKKALSALYPSLPL